MFVYMLDQPIYLLHHLPIITCIKIFEFTQCLCTCLTSLFTCYIFPIFFWYRLYSNNF